MKSSQDKRKALADYSRERAQIELAYAAIDLLEKMSGKTPARLIKSLQYEAMRAVKRMDIAADKLGVTAL